MIWLSLKTYKEATGDEAIKLLKVVKKIMEDTGVKIIPCVQPTDIYRAVQEVGIEIWAQHVDPIDPGRHFGWLSPYSAKQAGATGTVINHDEHAMQQENIKQTIEKAKEYHLKTLVICDTVELGHRVTAWDPDYVAYEKGDLIAGPTAMVDQEAESIKELVSLVKQPLVVGAGITTGDHAKKAIELGAQGVILASAVVKAEDQEKKLRELVEPFIKGK